MWLCSFLSYAFNGSEGLQRDCGQAWCWARLDQTVGERLGQRSVSKENRILKVHIDHFFLQLVQLKKTKSPFWLKKYDWKCKETSDWKCWLCLRSDLFLLSLPQSRLAWAPPSTQRHSGSRSSYKPLQQPAGTSCLVTDVLAQEEVDSLFLEKQELTRPLN